MTASFCVIPVADGDLMRYAIQRTHQGEVTYMADLAGRVVKRPRLVANLLTRALTTENPARQPKEANCNWVPWPTGCLPSKKPMTLFPPSRSKQ